MTRAGVTQTRTFAYSGSDLISETTPEGGTVTYTYDHNHHVTQRIDALNRMTTYAYDGYERLTAVQHYTWGPNPYCTINCPNQWNEQPGQDVNYYYDGPITSDYTQNYTWGRLSGVVFGGQITPLGFAYQYSYNQAGRITGNRMLVTNGGNGNVDMQGQYAWDNQGRLTSMTYPSGPVMNYQFDAMGRPSVMTETTCAGCQAWNAGYATYGSANQILTVGGTGTFPAGVTAYVNETRTYNNMLQLIHLTSGAESSTCAFSCTHAGGSIDMQYIYNTGHNNGRVSQTIDNVLGETVNYTYDYLHRLTGAAATNSSWGEAYAFDGFGNLTGKTPTVGTAPVFLGSAGSNATGGALPPNFDIENRLASNRSANLDTISYIYDPWGRRVWKQDNGAATTAEAYFYGATGQKLDTYSCSWGSTGTLAGGSEGINTYFAGKMLSEKNVFIATDRLGSVRADSNGVTMSYYPWGEERGQGTPDNRTKFAGYFRDWPGQDYAMARYYLATSASFWSPDPGGATAYSPNPASLQAVDPSNPGSWNRYHYALGDPINRIDPTGAIACDPDVDDGCSENPFADCYIDSCGGEDGGGDCTVQSDGTVSCPSTTVTVTAPPPDQVTTALAPTPGVLSTIGGILTQIGSVIGAAAGIVLFPISNNGCDTLDCPGAPGYAPKPIGVGRQWNACVPPVGTIGYRVDKVPPSRPHHPHTSDHVHLFVMQQNPTNGQCFWQPIGTSDPPPPPGAVPIGPAGGGGPL